ncbi:MAG: D-aminoacylase [Anaerolineae bacterium]|nr:D-aminoacylase [Anaerolineae bacterium]
MEFDLVIANGTIIDGTGQPRFRADLGIRQGKIAAIATGEALRGRQTLAAAGLAVAPGFIDVHSHSDWIVPLADHDAVLAPLLLQGVTTLVGGQCGFSPAPATEESIPLLDGFSEMLRDEAFAYRWRSMAEFLDTLDRDGVTINVACLVGHGALRYAVMGQRADRSTPPTAAEVDAMGRFARQAIQEGALGLSVGLAYAPGVFADNDELLPLLRATAKEGGMFAAHGRAYTWVSPFYRPMVGGTAHNIRSTRELLGLARQAGVRLQLSHLIFVGRRTWRTHRTVLRDVDRAIAEGVDVAFDAFPYTAGNSTINVVMPAWFLDGFSRNINDPQALRKLKRQMDLLRWTLGLSYPDITLLWGCAPEFAELEGLNMATIARRLGLPPFEAYVHVARVSEGKARVLLGAYSGDGLRTVLAHPRCAFMTDTILTRRGRHNPASFGTFPRVLGHYSRDLGLFSLEEAVRRMTSFPAERIGLQEVGRIAKGAWADLVLLDPVTVDGHATIDRPDAPPTGIQAVLISGQVVARNGQIVGQGRRGRVLRK